MGRREDGTKLKEQKLTKIKYKRILKKKSKDTLKFYAQSK